MRELEIGRSQCISFGPGAVIRMTLGRELCLKVVDEVK